jgi:hypothetical protein
MYAIEPWDDYRVMNWQKYARKSSHPDFMYYPKICPEGLRRTNKIIIIIIIRF